MRLFIRSNILHRPIHPITPAEGEMLHDLIVKHGLKKGLEFGTGEGVSSVWFGRAMQKTGGMLTTIEADRRLCKQAEELFKKEGLAKVIEVWRGNAFDFPALDKGPFDFIFLDAEKEDYAPLFRMSLPRLAPGGLFSAHNTANLKSHLKEFLSLIQSNPGLSTQFDGSKAGVSLTFKNT